MLIIRLSDWHEAALERPRWILSFSYPNISSFTEICNRLEGLKRAGIPAVISNSAGTFGCNQIFYQLMDYQDREGLNIPAGFIHVPRLPEQVLPILEKNLRHFLDGDLQGMVNIIER